MTRQTARHTWWSQALQNGWVQGPRPSASQEPSYWIVAVALLGAVVCTLPLAGLLALLLPGAVEKAPAVLGLLCLVAAAMCWRSSLHIFAACMGLVLWSTGAALVIANIVIEVDDWGSATLLLACSCLLLFQLAGMAIARMAWLHCLLGLVAGLALYGMAVTASTWWLPLWVVQLPMYALCLAWALCVTTEVSRLQRTLLGLPYARWALFIDAALLGLLLATWSFSETQSHLGQWLMGWSWFSEDLSHVWLLVRAALSTFCSAAAASWLIWHWRRHGAHTRPLLHLLVLAGLLLTLSTWFSPSLGWLAVVAASALATARWRIAALCGVLALVALGAFYYDLAWSLAGKGLGLMALGTVLLLGLLWLRKAGAAPPRSTAPPPYRAATPWVGVLLGAALAFAVVNWDVVRKEQVIAQGQRILVPLAPVDPRSLMQGDYMALRFDLPQEVQNALRQQSGSSIPVVATLDAQGHAHVQRLALPEDQPSTTQVILPLQRLKGKWTLVTDAYFFPEGQGTFFESARFGDFRVLPNGRALLVGLADAQGQPMALPTAAATAD